MAYRINLAKERRRNKLFYDSLSGNNENKLIF